MRKKILRTIWKNRDKLKSLTFSRIIKSPDNFRFSRFPWPLDTLNCHMKGVWISLARARISLEGISIEGTTPRDGGPKEEDGGGSSSGRLCCIAVNVQRHIARSPSPTSSPRGGWHTRGVARTRRFYLSSIQIRLGNKTRASIIYLHYRYFTPTRSRRVFMGKLFSIIFADMNKMTAEIRVSRLILREGGDNRARSRSDRSRDKGGTEFLPLPPPPSLR